MIVYFGENVSVTVQGQSWRTEKCEHCGQQFHYRVAITAGGTAMNPYFLDGSAPLRAEEIAREQLDHALRHQVFPAPCAYCNLFQSNMVPVIRAEQYRRMSVASRILFSFAPGFAMLGCVASYVVTAQFGESFLHPVAVAIWAGVPVLMLAIAIWLRLEHRARSAAFDPNTEEYRELRRQFATALSLKPEEFAELRIPTTPAATVRLGSRPRDQLAGQNCVRCGLRISGDFDSRYCDACGLPVHDRCAVPTDGVWCPTCGASEPKAS